MERLIMGIRIALAGNPNCGKTTMFNDLTGASQYVGNWPGVTVEKKEGTYAHALDVTITDLPGVYSLSPYSPEEIVTRDYLLGDAAIRAEIAPLIDRLNQFIAEQKTAHRQSQAQKGKKSDDNNNENPETVETP